VTLSFTLSMPSRWSGEEKVYAVFKNFAGKKAARKAQELLSHHSWHFSWGDEWGATIVAKRVYGFEFRRLKKESAGFCGYEWMVESILVCGEIRQTIRDEAGKVIQSPYVEKKVPAQIVPEMIV
jgi:hypothetical protein